MIYGYIYRTTCLPTGTIYIGQKKARELVRDYFGSGLAIQNAVKKYGADKFTIEVIEFVETKQQLDNAERRHIATHRLLLGRKGLYNIRDGGNGGPIGPHGHGVNYGKDVSEEARRNIGNARRGKKHTEETKRKIGLANAGDNCSAATRALISKAMKGRVFSSITIERMAAARRGKPLTEETKQKLSLALKGRPHSEEHNKKLSLAAFRRYERERSAR